MTAAVILSVALGTVQFAVADDFKTIDGKEYKNVTVSRVEPDGIVLRTKSGISKVYFTELPKDIQQRFNYDPNKAAAYSAEQNAAIEQVRKQQDEDLRQYEEEQKKKNKEFDKEQRRIQQRQKIPGLQARLKDLQDEEDDLNQRIWEAKQLLHGVGRSVDHGTRMYTPRYENPNKANLPEYEQQLKDVRDEKDKVRKQLEEAERTTGK